MLLLFNLPMKTVEETRHERLLMLRDEYGTVAALAKKLEKSYTQVSQWINRSVSTRNGQPRSINSESAREIEIKTNKPRGWMDQPVTQSQWEEELNMDQYALLSKFGERLKKMGDAELKATDKIIDGANDALRAGKGTDK